MSYFITGSPNKEHRTDRPPPTRIWERSKGDTTCPTTFQNPSCWHPPWLSNACLTRKDPEVEWLAKDNLGTNPITIKPEIVSHVAEPFFWFPWLACSPPGHPFQWSLALSAWVSPWTIHFQVLDKSPFLGSGRYPPSCNYNNSHHS